MKKILKSIFMTFVMIFAAQVCYAAELNFAHMSDVHLPDMNPSGHPVMVLKDAIYEINKTPGLDFVMVTGDIVDCSGKEMLTYSLNQLNEIKVPWYYTLGNHDVYFGNPSLTKSEVLALVKETDKNFTFDSLNYVYKPKKGYTVIGFDDVDQSGCYIRLDEERLKFLDEAIANSGDDTVIIFMHGPLYPPIDKEDHNLWNAEDLYAVLYKYPERAIAVFAGHFHAPRITKEGNILHAAAPSLRYSQAYRTVNVKNKLKKVVFTFKYNETSVPQLKERSWGARGEGAEEDKNIQIVLDKKAGSKKVKSDSKKTEEEIKPAETVETDEPSEITE